MKTVRVVAAVIRQGDRIFATARGYVEFKGQWEFPGGKIEVGEMPQQAIIREIKEELDVMVSVGDLIDTIILHFTYIWIAFGVKLLTES